MGKQALDEKRLSGGFHVDPDSLVIIGLDTKDGPEHPLWDKRASLPIDENLGKDMMMNGFHGSIEVRKNGDATEVVFGRQRVKAARWANKQLTKAGKEPILVTCLVKKLNDATAFGVRVGENVHRQGLSTLDKADEIQRYISMGRNEEDAAVTFGMTANGIRNLLKLQDLDSHVRKAVEANDLSPSAAAELSGLSRDEQREQLAELLKAGAAGEKVTRRTAKQAVKKKKTSGNDEASVAPAKRLVSNVLKLDKRHGNVLPRDFVKGVMWCLGDIGDTSIDGLRALVKEAEEVKANRQATKASKKKVKA